MTTAHNNSTAQQVLQNVFGYADFRHQQANIIDELVAGNDVFTLMPTGGGKSLCYQIPALVLDGVGIVISPLIALMQDQVDALKILGVNAEFLNSSQDYQRQQQIEQQLLNGELDLLYIAPERLLTERMQNLLLRTNIALFAIDEAHCVSQWGHDFRPEYQQLSILHNIFPNTPRIALTATADQRTRDEIVDLLALHQAKQFVHSFDRPNIQYRINDLPNAKERLWDFISSEHNDDAGIVYCLSRKMVESTAQWLSAKGRVALPYHAGLANEVKAQHQQRFLQEEQVIIVATIAFGMGIDKPDVRFVAHLNIPKSIEAYYQETGRAGRDGQPANAWLAYGMQDVIKLKQMSQNSDGNELFKQITQRKLNALLGYCEVSSCRRQALLQYFGEQLDTPCGNCDNCLTPPITWDGTLAAKKALSTVYRTKQRFGVTYQIDVLLGKTTPRIINFGHNQLSTFGIGEELSAQAWQGVFRQLISMGFLSVDMEFGALKLTEQARPVLKGEQQIQLREQSKKAKAAKQKRSPKNSQAITDLTPQDTSLFEQLRAQRTLWAKDRGVPPFVIFHDATLIAIAQAKPNTAAELLTINGIGASKNDLYGEEIIAIIAQSL
ncbi:DNA helicase RecQ [Thalassotalea sp. ND16A]|uniref:DNA helicase RecQ n=1 Tax=Thalassotalea sp. ND16A TaxID=1535422 RepID=UPI00051A359E|nr:DNA helicase RecQ [Thalassotalea sp. ND16A]KGJ90467.1 hypothetical protein ND16A_1863 [Thalassotalea sp. ND16A]